MADNNGQLVHALGKALGLFALLEVLGLKLGALGLETLLVGNRGAHGLGLGQQEVTGIARLHVHQVTHLAEMLDPLQQDQCGLGHDALLSSQRRGAGRGNGRA